MTLSTGTKLVHYEISAQIGRGGMGEVYQAKDTKLGRDVAIKVLPEEFARDTDRVARFQREAKLLASLNHPNIAAIHGLEESEGIHFLVMELIEGETLEDRIKSGPIPVEEALKLALQMAEALEAAHEKGVIHRDLKPANIKVTPDGKVKILDFGLAKAYVGDQENSSPADSPTLSAAATRQGVILGTAAYMSPEQARGKFVDKRADIWAFGAVLYEMLTGEKAFAGGDTTDTLAAVLRSEPEWEGLPANLHWRVKEVLERCLEKKARDRYSGINDARVDIQKTLSDPSGIFPQPVSTVDQPRTPSRQIFLWALITIFLVIAAGIVVWNMRTPEKPAIIRLDHDLPKEQQFSLNQRGYLSIAVSPNGRQIVYGTTEGLYIRSVDELDARLITGTDEFSNGPFFSPDGQWVAYRSENERKLKKISINGGAPSILCDIPSLGYAGGRWYENNTIVFTLVPDGVMRIPSSGGTPEPLTKIRDLAEVMEMGGIQAFPQVLPDGKTLLYTKIHLLSGDAQIEIQSMESEETKPLFVGSEAQYLSTGHLLYALNENNVNNLFAVPFDLDRLEVTGGSVSILEGVSAFAVSDSGTLGYIPQPPNTDESGGVIGEGRTLVLVDRDGHEEPLDTPPNDYSYPKFSPDGTQLAISVESD